MNAPDPEKRAKALIEEMRKHEQDLVDLDWKEATGTFGESWFPITHTATVVVDGCTLRVHRLTNGAAAFDPEDMQEFFGMNDINAWLEG